MKLAFVLSCFSLIIFLMLASCSKDSTEPEVISQVEPWVGTWDMTESKAISKNDPGTFLDLMALFQISGTVVIQPSGDYTVSIIVPGDTIIQTGQFTTLQELENQMTGGDPDVTVTFDTDMVTIIRDNQTWDFGNGEEPALERTVYTRRELVF